MTTQQLFEPSGLVARPYINTSRTGKKQKQRTTFCKRFSLLPSLPFTCELFRPISRQIRLAVDFSFFFFFFFFVFTAIGTGSRLLFYGPLFPGKGHSLLILCPLSNCSHAQFRQISARRPQYALSAFGWTLLVFGHGKKKILLEWAVPAETILYTCNLCTVSALLGVFFPPQPP